MLVQSIGSHNAADDAATGLLAVPRSQADVGRSKQPSAEQANGGDRGHCCLSKRRIGNDGGSFDCRLAKSGRICVFGPSNCQTAKSKVSNDDPALFSTTQHEPKYRGRAKNSLSSDLRVSFSLVIRSQSYPAQDTVNSMDKQQFLILGKSARGRALCELINRATAEPGIFTFGELLSLPNVQEVRADISCGGLQGLLHLLGPARCSNRADQKASAHPTPPTAEADTAGNARAAAQQSAPPSPAACKQVRRTQGHASCVLCTCR